MRWTSNLNVARPPGPRLLIYKARLFAFCASFRQVTRSSKLSPIFHPYVSRSELLTVYVSQLKVRTLFRCRCDDDEEDEEDGGEDPYEFSLGAVIDECARMASQDDSTNPGTTSSGGSNAKKRKIVQSSYFSDEEDED